MPSVFVGPLAGGDHGVFPAAQVKGVDGFGFAENFTTPDHHKPWI